MDMLRSHNLHLAPPPRLPGGARTVVAALLLLGALALAGCLAEEGLPTSSGGPVAATWNDVANIFWNPGGCGGCHPPAGSGPGTTILDYASLINDNTGNCNGAITKMITIGDRSQSCLYLAVTGVSPTSMSSYLTLAQAETIGAWIDSGAPGP